MDCRKKKSDFPYALNTPLPLIKVGPKVVEEEGGCFVRILRSTLHFKQIFCFSKGGLSIPYLPGGGGGDCFGVGKMGCGSLNFKITLYRTLF